MVHISILFIHAYLSNHENLFGQCSSDGKTAQLTFSSVVFASVVILILDEDIDVDMSAQQMPLMFVAILLVFRTGYAYNRYMEGRGHVGTMVLKGDSPPSSLPPQSSPTEARCGPWQCGSWRGRCRPMW